MEAQEKVRKEKNTSFMKNVVMLIFSQMLIKVLGFVYRLVIINIKGFGDIGNGYYNTGYQVYSLLLVLSSVGIPNAISKLVSEKLALGDNKGAHKIFIMSMKIFTVVGIFFSLLLFFGAGFIATNILNVPSVKNILRVLAPAIMFVSVSSVLRGYFAGLGTQKATSVSQTLEQFFNCVLTITFVYALIGKDPATMAMGGNISTTLAILISFAYLVVFYKRRKKGIIAECNEQTVPEENKTASKLIKTIFAVSIPMTIGSLIPVIIIQ
jgi:stage V sporulation protein B